MNYNYVNDDYARYLYACCYYYCIKQQGKQKRERKREIILNWICASRGTVFYFFRRTRAHNGEKRGI